MGIFKLTFLTVGALGTAMLHFGRDDGLPADRLGLEPGVENATIEPVSASLTAPALVVSTRSEPVKPLTETPPIKATLTVAPKITPPAPGSDAARAIAAAKEMAKSAAQPVMAAAEIPAAAGFETKYVSASAVNMRAGPSTRNGIVGRLTRGTAVLITGETGNGWSQIKVIESGQRGFMASKFLTSTR